MSKKKIGIVLIAIVILGFGSILYQQMIPERYVPADDEIALDIQLDIDRDIGLLVFDYRADGQEHSGGISNADRTLMANDSAVIQVWNRQDLNSASDAVELSIRFRMITKYVEPNFENIYPEDITELIDTPISFHAQFGETYFMTITGDQTSGYKAVLNG
ncbi:MAG: hypothetical protein ACOX7A_00890 [Lawsonibacter sp.]|jgi:hypothetical protein